MNYGHGRDIGGFVLRGSIVGQSDIVTKIKEKKKKECLVIKTLIDIYSDFVL